MLKLLRIHGASARLLSTQTAPTQSHFTFAIPMRSFIEISGQDTLKFLQSLCTNDVNALRSASCSNVAAAFLSAKGRIIADTIIHKVNQNEDCGVTVIVEAHERLSKNLLTYLNMYRLRSAIKISPVRSYYSVLSGETTPTRELAPGDVVATTSSDPRNPKLGNRSLIRRSDDGANEADDIGNLDYESWRILNGIAEGPEIFNKIPLECNLDLLNSVDFEKGCYVGQELTARTKFKGLVRKRIVPFVRCSLVRQLTLQPPASNFLSLDHEALRAVLQSNPLPGDHSSAVSDPKVFRIVSGEKDSTEDSGDGSGGGEVICIDSGKSIGLAMLRLEQLYATSPLTFQLKSENSETIDVAPFRPFWWPDLDPHTGKALI